MTPDKKVASTHLVDGIAPVNQAVVDGSLTKDADRNVHMTVLLDRKDSSGSGLSPLYWVERMYQALAAKVFPGPQEAFDSVIVQAKATGLSEMQEEKILKWLGAMGMGVKGSKEALESKPLKENGGYSVLDYRQKQVQANFTVQATEALTKNKAYVETLKRIASSLEYYKANKDRLTAEVRVAELREKGFADCEILKSCDREGLQHSMVTAELLRNATMEMPAKFRVTADNGVGIDIHYVGAASEAEAKSAVKKLYAEDVKISDAEKVQEKQHTEDQKPEGEKGLVEKKASVSTKFSRFGEARELIRNGTTEAECLTTLKARHEKSKERDLLAVVRSASLLNTAPESREAIADPFVAFYANECEISEERAMTELRGLDATVRKAIDQDFKAVRMGQAVPPPPTAPVSPGKKRVYDPVQKGWVEVDATPGTTSTV